MIASTIASWVVALDLRTSGLLSTVAAPLVAWSERSLVTRAREHLAATRPACMADASLLSLMRGAEHLGPDAKLAIQVSELLNEPALMLLNHPGCGVVDIGIGQLSTGLRQVTEEAWTHLRANGVPLLTWAEVVRLRMSLRTRAGGVA